jgi:hypothetical protein
LEVSYSAFSLTLVVNSSFVVTFLAFYLRADLISFTGAKESGWTEVMGTTMRYLVVLPSLMKSMGQPTYLANTNAI